MKENDWWARHVKPALNRPTRHWAAWKQQDIYNKGLPDAIVCCQGEVAQLELKLVTLPKRADTRVTCDLSLEQRRHLQVWHEAGGRAWVLIGTDCKQWVLVDIATAATAPAAGATWSQWLAMAMISGRWPADLPNIGEWLQDDVETTRG